ncbi:hypothetical protein NLI96_g6782 [Meripilus lineatus]|uniref:NACHT domain-containing protein n=1 Tax=Meripilus lineatus TaxID=2056292 RepID=A0AAD5V5M8_9APHY|nr:hypothetical protein NLI96_g6782 [Physisporinus lineatus]
MPSSRSKAARQTAMNALITSLELLETISDGIPVVGDPLKAAAAGAVKLLKQVEVAKGNAEVFIRLNQDIGTLTERLFKPLKESGLDPSEFPLGLAEDITNLIKRVCLFLSSIYFDLTNHDSYLNPICQEILDKSKRNVFARFFGASKDEGDIIEFKDKINSAILAFIAAGVIGARVQGAQDKAERKIAEYKELIKELPRAKSAGWNAAGRSNAHVSCFEGTREGVLQTINDWIYGDPSTTPRVFWLNGLAGIGKSTIARTIAERASERGILGGSFFFSRNDNELNNVETLFSTLAHQLAQFNAAYLEAVAAALAKDSDLGSKNMATQFEKLFFDPISRSDPERAVLLLVLDALDEASPKDAVKETLQLLLSVDVPFALRVFLTSRPEAHIRRVFDNDRHHSRCVLHNIEDSIVKGDIRRFLEHKLPTIPKELGIPLPYWPSPSDLDAVVDKSDRLFIFAMTVVRFVADDRVPDPKGRLTQLLRAQVASGSSPYQQLDQLYLHVLQSAVDGVVDVEHLGCLHATLTAIVLFRNPIPLAALAALIGYDPDQVLLSLYHLHSIILVPSTIQDAPKIYHLSFPDFITDSSRCTDTKFYVDIQSQEISLLLQCLGTMKKSLHFNMGGFDIGPYTPTSFFEHLDSIGRVIGHFPVINSMSNKDVSQDTLNLLISPELGYACQFWCSHLLKIENSTSDVVDQLKAFSFKYLLFWVEAMSLLGLVEPARVAMRDAHQWASKLGCKKDLIDILYDGYRLIWLYQSHISSYTMNVYLIALPWMPQNTLLSKTYKSLTTSKVVCPKSLIWSPMLSSENIPYKKELYSVTYASDGKYLATGSEDGSIDLWDAFFWNLY